MYMKLCPDGAEGASYSMLTTFGNIALVCASNLGNIVASFWYVIHILNSDAFKIMLYGICCCMILYIFVLTLYPRSFSILLLKPLNISDGTILQGCVQ